MATRSKTLRSRNAANASESSTARSSNRSTNLKQSTLTDNLRRRVAAVPDVSESSTGAIDGIESTENQSLSVLNAQAPATPPVEESSPGDQSSGSSSEDDLIHQTSQRGRTESTVQSLH